MKLIKRVFLIIPALIFAIVIMALVPNEKPSLNSKKECRITDQEKIEAAVKYLLWDYPPMIFLKKDEDIMGGRAYIPDQPIAYEDISDFIDSNPECCKIEKLKGGEVITGNYNVKFIDWNNQERSYMKRIFVGIDDCGYVEITPY